MFAREEAIAQTYSIRFPGIFKVNAFSSSPNGYTVAILKLSSNIKY